MIIETPQDATADKRSRPFFAPSLRPWSLLEAAVFLACVPTWLAFAARWWWPFDLATHFAWHGAALLPLGLLVCWRRKRKRLALLIVASVAVNLARIAPLYVPPAAEPTPGPTLRVMTLNVRTGSQHYAEVLQAVREEDPDVLVLIEVNPAWVEAMAPLREQYPFRGFRSRGDNFGMALYTRLDADAIEFANFGRAEVPTAIARARWRGKPLTIVGTHPVPPVWDHSAKLRNEQLAELVDFAASEDGSLILAGDLNTTPYCPYFRDLLRGAGLLDSSRGYGVRATWSPGIDLLGLPIDHVLHTPDWVVVDRRVGADVGSDHRAVIVDLAPAVAPD